jgi:prepilin peptidase CpaA
MSTAFLPALCAVLFASACALVDVRTRRIPNELTMLGLAVGVALNGAAFGLSGLVYSLAGAVLAAAILIGPFALGGIGAGDVKMMGAVGALLGPRLGIASLLLGMILGGIFMIVHLKRRGRLREKSAALGHMVAAAALSGTVAPLRASADHADAVALPYSVPLGLATALVVLSGFVAR